jgi:hypothetical protein
MSDNWLIAILLWGSFEDELVFDGVFVCGFF